ncbi:hypothetical protein E2320_010413 [Naja naja]|nr:hypothetical protein E2320_010413 [Naja naja]
MNIGRGYSGTTWRLTAKRLEAVLFYPRKCSPPSLQILFRASGQSEFSVVIYQPALSSFQRNHGATSGGGTPSGKRLTAIKEESSSAFCDIRERLSCFPKPRALNGFQQVLFSRIALKRLAFVGRKNVTCKALFFFFLQPLFKPLGDLFALSIRGTLTLVERIRRNAPLSLKPKSVSFPTKQSACLGAFTRKGCKQLQSGFCNVSTSALVPGSPRGFHARVLCAWINPQDLWAVHHIVPWPLGSLLSSYRHIARTHKLQGLRKMEFSSIAFNESNSGLIQSFWNVSIRFTYLERRNILFSNFSRFWLPCKKVKALLTRNPVYKLDKNQIIQGP